jgi:hypothetical protein
MRIAKLDVAPLEITVPPDFAPLRMDGSEESSLGTILQGPDRYVIVNDPEAALFTLKEREEILLRTNPDASILYASTTGDGFHPHPAGGQGGGGAVQR